MITHCPLPGSKEMIKFIAFDKYFWPTLARTKVKCLKEKDNHLRITWHGYSVFSWFIFVKSPTPCLWKATAFKLHLSAVTRFLFYTVLWDLTLRKEHFVKQEKSHLSHLSVVTRVAIWQVDTHSPPGPARGMAQASLPAVTEPPEIHQQSERRNTGSYSRWQRFRWRAIRFRISLHLLWHDSGSSQLIIASIDCFSKKTFASGA